MFKLSFDEQKELVSRAKQGDKKAAEELICAYEPLIISIAAKYSRSDIFDDLKQEGKVAVLQAIQKFDPNVGVSFFTYVFYWVKRNMDRCVLKHSNVKISTHSKLSDIPKVFSLDEPVVNTDSDKEICFGDTLQCSSNVEREAESNVMLQEIVKSLNEEERKILLLRLQGYTFKEITKELGITERQLCFRLKKMRTKLQRFLKAS